MWASLRGKGKDNASKIKKVDEKAAAQENQSATFENLAHQILEEEEKKKTHGKWEGHTGEISKRKTTYLQKQLAHQSKPNASSLSDRQSTLLKLKRAIDNATTYLDGKSKVYPERRSFLATESAFVTQELAAVTEAYAALTAPPKKSLKSTAAPSEPAQAAAPDPTQSAKSKPKPTAARTPLLEPLSPVDEELSVQLIADAPDAAEFRRIQNNSNAVIDRMTREAFLGESPLIDDHIAPRRSRASRTSRRSRSEVHDDAPPAPKSAPKPIETVPVPKPAPKPTDNAAASKQPAPKPTDNAAAPKQPVAPAPSDRKKDKVAEVQKKADEVKEVLKAKIDKQLEKQKKEGEDIEKVDEKTGNLEQAARKFDKKPQVKSGGCCSCLPSCSWFKSSNPVKKDKAAITAQLKRPLLGSAS